MDKSEFLLSKTSYFPKIDKGLFDDGDRKLFILKTHLRYKREGVWHRMIQIESWSLTEELNAESMFDKMAMFISRVYETQQLHDVNSDEFRSIDENQISEKERLLQEEPNFKKLYK